MPEIITNTDQLLSEVTNQILPNSKSLDVLVGYLKNILI
jgi:hypothetical protein